MGDFKQLTVWQRSRDVAVATYRITHGLPASEREIFGAQMKSAALSISSNIAEGSGRQTGRDQARHYGIAMGSARELESLVLIGAEVEVVDRKLSTAALGKIEEVEKMLHGLIRYCVTQDAGLRAKRSTLTRSVASRLNPASVSDSDSD